MTRTVLGCRIFKGHATKFTKALWKEAKTPALEAILRSDQRRTDTIVGILTPDLESQMESICKIDVFATTRPSRMETLKDEEMPEPDAILSLAAEKPPDLLKLLYSLMDRKEGCKDSTELISLLGILAYTRHKIKTNGLQRKVCLHLHASGTRRHGLDMLHGMGVCCSYQVINSAIKEISKKAADHVAALGQQPNVITAYDNFEYTMGVRQQRLDGTPPLLIPSSRSSTTILVCRIPCSTATSTASILYSLCCSFDRPQWPLKDTSRTIAKYAKSFSLLMNFYLTTKGRETRRASVIARSALCRLTIEMSSSS